DPVVASESCAFELIGARFERELRPGELLIADDNGTRTFQAVPAVERGSLCIFEFFYLARPDTRLEGVEIHGARVRMGERLAAEAPPEADPRRPLRARVARQCERAAGAAEPGARPPRRDRLLTRDRDPVQRGADQEPLRAPDV